jgi:hypothetical protein
VAESRTSDDSRSQQQQQQPGLHSVLLQQQQQGPRGGTPPHVDLEPELLTNSQDIEVVLGDTTVLPCKVAHLGTNTLFI